MSAVLDRLSDSDLPVADAKRAVSATGRLSRVSSAPHCYHTIRPSNGFSARNLQSKLIRTSALLLERPNAAAVKVAGGANGETEWTIGFDDFGLPSKFVGKLAAR
jgi:hypothetical protein